MRIFNRNMMLLNEADDNKGAGGAGSPPADPKPAATPPPQSKAGEQPKPAESAPKAEGEGSPLDFYQTETKEEGDKKTAAPANDKQKKGNEPEKIEDPATGYGKEPVEPPPAEPPKPAEKIDLGYEVDTKGLSEDLAKPILELAKKHNASKEITQALLDDQKAKADAAETERVRIEKETNRVKQQTRAQWHNELKNHPDFGGDKFDANVQRAERVLEEFMPNTKKRLTETKSMLPPYVMRDLAKLADHIYATETSVHGDPPTPPVEEEESSPLDFYNKPQAG